MIKRLLIANRGEIACRIMRTAQARGIHCVAVYSHCDKNSLHVQHANEAWCIGENPAQQSYLDSHKIIQVAKQSQCDAIHPGYGFLSENADFAEACAQQSIRFIGPPADAIRQMGSKIEAKERVAEVNIPLLPGLDLSKLSEQELAQQAASLDYPVLLKASAGGGGKGMRIVEKPEDFQDAFQRAQSEAEKSFGDKTLLAEKYLREPRHVEVQIFMDQQGNGVYLFDRDCSIQRRHQKIIEEAPAPFLDKELRKSMGESALRAAQCIQYVGAGTIEFLLDADQKYYFMEMNTRLQVEHPVSEFITGLDFVAWQLDIAEGLPLPLQQGVLSEQGHSIEVRLYAEDPQKDFLPSTGQLKQLQFPEESTDLRIDTGVKQSDEISAFYDPLLAKIISHGDNREQAIQKLLFALQQTKISGISSNLDYLKALLRSEAFHQGLLSTHFLEKYPLEFTASESERNRAFFIAALAFYLTENRTGNNDPWEKNIGWRLNQAPCYPITLRHCSSEESIDKNLSVTRRGKNRFSIDDEEGSLSIECFSSAYKDQFQFSIPDQVPVLVSVFRQKDTLTLHFTNYSLSFLQQKLSSNNFQKSQSSGSKFNHAPMSGRIVEIFCASEQTLAAGNPILAMEAMKMEHIIKAPEAGQVTQFHVQPESFIEEGSLLFDFQKDS